MDWGVGDLLAVTKLAWDLYHKCFLAAKEAPDEFRQLVTELGSLQGILINLRDDVNSDSSFTDKFDPHRREVLERCLKSCFLTLHQLQALVGKYREMGLGDGVQFWRRISWTTRRNEISDMKSRILAHSTSISLCLNSLQNSSLARIEARLLPALEKQESARSEEEEIAKEVGDKDTPLIPAHRKRSSMDQSDGLEQLSRRMTESTLVSDHSGHPGGPSSPAFDDEENVTPKQSLPRLRNTSITSSRSRRKSSVNYGHGSEDEYNDTKANARKLLAQLPSNFSRHSPRHSPTPSHTPSFSNREEPIDIGDEVKSAQIELSRIREHERTQRPLRIPSSANIPRPDEKLASRFQEDAEVEMQYMNINTRDWLRMGTWWLLKAKFNLQSLEKPQTASSTSSSTDRTNYHIPSSQGYIDLLKASWIVFDVVLKGDHETSLRVKENRDVLYYLIDGLAHESRAFRTGAPDAETLNDPDLSYDIWEPMQAHEESFGEDFGEAYNNRWITVQLGEGGGMDENALSRTFVDAAIGGKAHQVFPKGAPYLLILSTKEGESEPKVTLCNQRGSLCITRDFTVDDLQEFSTTSDPVIDVDYYEGIKSLQLSFDGLETSISFPYEFDLQHFLQRPKSYFNAVRRREPRMLPKATEALIFKSSVDVIEQLHPSSMKLMSRKHRFESCDLRILEVTCKEGWRTTRRLVTSSSAGEKQPWCNEFFLPMDRVQLSSDHPRQVTMKWSDCSQEDYTQTNGQYATFFSHVYDDTKPNNAFSLLFNSEEEAGEFQEAILSLRRKVTYSWENGPSERGHIYEIEDTDPDPKKYKAIMFIQKQHEYAYSQIFYHYCDSDFSFDSKSFRLHFPQLKYTTYLSNHYQKLYRPTKTPQFSYCEIRASRKTVEFLELPVAMSFLSALASRCKLVFVRRAHHISTKAPSRLGGSTKSNKGAAEVFVWRDGNRARVVSRWSDLVADKWVTAEVEPDTLIHHPGDNKASLRSAKYDRGQMIDMELLAAVRPKHKEPGARKEGYLTWAFNSVKDQEEFVKAVEGQTIGESQIEQLDAWIDRLGRR